MNKPSPTLPRAVTTSTSATPFTRVVPPRAELNVLTSDLYLRRRPEPGKVDCPPPVARAPLPTATDFGNWPRSGAR